MRHCIAKFISVYIIFVAEVPRYPGPITLKTESCHIANFVVTSGIVGCRYSNMRATNDDKVPRTLSFQYDRCDLTMYKRRCRSILLVNRVNQTVILRAVTTISARCIICLPQTHLDRDKMFNISRTTFSNAFSRIRKYEFRLRFHWILFLIIIFHRLVGAKPLSEPRRCQAIIWTNNG